MPCLVSGSSLKWSRCRCADCDPELWTTRQLHKVQYAELRERERCFGLHLSELIHLVHRPHPLPQHHWWLEIEMPLRHPQPIHHTMHDVQLQINAQNCLYMNPIHIKNKSRNVDEMPGLLSLLCLRDLIPSSCWSCTCPILCCRHGCQFWPALLTVREQSKRAGCLARKTTFCWEYTYNNKSTCHFISQQREWRSRAATDAHWWEYGFRSIVSCVTALDVQRTHVQYQSVYLVCMSHTWICRDHNTQGTRVTWLRKIALLCVMMHGRFQGWGRRLVASLETTLLGVCRL
jgi:hypothetical protein